ncbi:MAG: FecR family protein [Odoribacteraceae bacterium]|nr:FecR family protein [Odoribacteraceae bacterium]
MKRYDSLNAEKEWQILQPRLKHHASIPYRRIVSIAAAVVLCTGGIYLWLLSNQGDQAPREATSILPGTFQATLYTGDGTAIPIRKDMTGALLQDSSIVIEKNLLIHRASSAPQEEVADRMIVTPRGGELPVVLADGTRVWLNSDTRLTFPAIFSGKERVVTLYGGAYFEVAENKEMPFIVKTARSRVQVYGTAFNMSAYSNDSRQKTALEKGSISVWVGDNEYRLYPNEQAEVWADGEVAIVPVDAKKQGTWRKGKFVFENERLEEIMNQLARWYDVKIVFANARLMQLHFSGELNRYNDLERLLSMIELTTHIGFKIDGTTIIIYSQSITKTMY